MSAPDFTAEVNASAVLFCEDDSPHPFTFDARLSTRCIAGCSEFFSEA